MVPTGIAGCVILKSETVADKRGGFHKFYDREVFRELGLDPDVAQMAVSHNLRRGTVRGLHLQRPPFGESKTVRASRGAIFDVAVDLRENSPTMGFWEGCVLEAAGGKQMHIPAGCAHGFQTLEDGSEASYLIAGVYHPAAEDGVRWNDPHLGIAWPIESGITISARDAALPLFALAPRC